ncbi:Hpt domain-containing protein [Thalassotalea euphylliae]|uniref:Hpt domain-containing protein n=1 Tax=Thalassotalea euphylliae TaxID=1655234 RepID=UPI003631DD0C
MSSANVIDSELIQGYLDNLGKDVIKQMLALYEQQSSVYLAEIEQALQAQSQEQWHERCHKMKGAAGSVGLIAVHAQLVSIENVLESWQEKVAMLATLKTLNAEALTAFDEWLASV